MSGSFGVLVWAVFFTKTIIASSSAKKQSI